MEFNLAGTPGLAGSLLFIDLGLILSGTSSASFVSRLSMS